MFLTRDFFGYFVGVGEKSNQSVEIDDDSVSEDGDEDESTITGIRT
jgi:hypothetical protein